MKSKALVLGTGTFQLGLLRYLKATGYETHIIGNRPGDPACAEADVYHSFSYMEMERVLALCRSLNAVQVFSAASDASIHCQSFVQSKLGMRGFTPQVIDFFSDKSNYKTRLKSSALGGIPDVMLCENKEQLQQFLQRFPEGIIIKPRSGSGSTNVVHLKSDADIAVHEWKGKPAEYLAESFIAGAELGGDLLVHNGVLVFYWPTRKKVNKFKVPCAHLVLQHNAETGAVSVFLQRIIRMLALPDGIYNADIILQQSRPYLIDLSPRMGGNCIPDLIHLSMGVNEWQFMTDLLTGKCLPDIRPAWKCPHGVYILGAEREGIIEQLTGKEHPFHSQLVELFWKVRPGEKVYPFTQGGKHLGYIIYKAACDAELLQVQEQIESFPWFRLR